MNLAARPDPKPTDFSQSGPVESSRVVLTSE